MHKPRGELLIDMQEPCEFHDGHRRTSAEHLHFIVVKLRATNKPPTPEMHRDWVRLALGAENGGGVNVNVELPSASPI